MYWLKSYTMYFSFVVVVVDDCVDDHKNQVINKLTITFLVRPTGIGLFIDFVRICIFTFSLILIIILITTQKCVRC